jgi:hypothetical protein
VIPFVLQSLQFSSKSHKLIQYTMSSRPAHTRTLSTNLGGSRGHRPLEGKLAIVTGASRGTCLAFSNSQCFLTLFAGIGVAISQYLASKGANLILNYTSDSSAEACSELSSSLTEEYGVTCLVIQADMGTPAGPAHISKFSQFESCFQGVTCDMRVVRSNFL